MEVIVMLDSSGEKQRAESTVDRRARSASKLTKGERTKKRLMSAARRSLATHGYHAARIEDIAKAADVSKGTFYLYFENKRAITLAVMAELLAEGQQELLASRTGDDPFLEILEPTAAYVRAVIENGGLVRALLQFVHDDSEAARIWADTTHQWLARVNRVMDSRLGKGTTDAATRTLVAYAMNWMVDGVLQSLLARDDSHLREVVQSPEQLAETLSVLWYRAVYGENPDPERLAGVSPVVAFRLRGAQSAGGA
jgi:AcrR family transcriptional regulator